MTNKRVPAGYLKLNNELENIIIYAVRYGIKRSSTAICDIVRYIDKNMKGISERALDILYHDVIQWLSFTQDTECISNYEHPINVSYDASAGMITFMHDGYQVEYSSDKNDVRNLHMAYLLYRISEEKTRRHLTEKERCGKLHKRGG